MTDYTLLSNAENIKYAIKRLEFMLRDDVWATLASGEVVSYENNTEAWDFDPYYGLCSNALYPLEWDTDRKTLFESWHWYSGRKSFPIPNENYNSSSDNRTLYRNPKRKELAEHCLTMLKDYISKHPQG